MGLLDLLELEPGQRLFPGLGFLVHGLFLQGALQLPALPVGGSHRLRLLRKLPAAVGVQNLHVLLFVQQRLVLMLAVDVYQKLRQLLHLLRGDGLAVDAVHILPHADLAADGYGPVFRLLQLQLLQLPADALISGEDQLHKGALRPLAQHLPLELPTEGQVHAPDQQGFPRAGLSGEDVQALAELHLRLFHQCQVLHMQASQHLLSPFRLLARRTPRPFPSRGIRPRQIHPLRHICL